MTITPLDLADFMAVAGALVVAKSAIWAVKRGLGLIR